MSLHRRKLAHTDYKELPKTVSKHSRLDKVRDRETLMEIYNEESSQEGCWEEIGREGREERDEEC